MLKLKRTFTDFEQVTKVFNKSYKPQSNMKKEDHNTGVSNEKPYQEF